MTSRRKRLPARTPEEHEAFEAAFLTYCERVVGEANIGAAIEILKIEASAGRLLVAKMLPIVERHGAEAPVVIALVRGQLPDCGSGFVRIHSNCRKTAVLDFDNRPLVAALALRATSLQRKVRAKVISKAEADRRWERRAEARRRRAGTLRN